MAKKGETQVTPDEARAFLDAFDKGPSDEELENAFIWLHIQNAVILGAHAPRLCALNATIHHAEHHNLPCLAEKQEREKIYETLQAEAEKELAENGLPESWKRQAQRKN
jgi:hypothetical protein